MENADSIFRHHYQQYIGIALACAGSLMIGVSYTASKTAHNKVRASMHHSNRERNSMITSGRTPLFQRRHFGGNVDSPYTSNDPVSPSTTPLLLPRKIVATKSLEQKNQLLETVRYPEWWMSIVLLLLGESLNFLAYSFASTSLIAPLGTLSIISGAISGYLYLGERIALRMVGGMFGCVAGVALIVLVSREGSGLPEGDIVDALISSFLSLGFLIYLACLVTLTAICIFFDNFPVLKSNGGYSRSIFGHFETSPDASHEDPHVPPITHNDTVGDRFMLIRVTLTAIFSGITVLATKAISSLLTLTLHKMFTFWITYPILIVLLVSALLTLYYTNKALSRFDSTQVLPSEFAGFTFFAVLGSAMLYHDFEGASIGDIMVFVCGCLTSFVGVYFICSPAKAHLHVHHVRKRPRIVRPGTLSPPTIEDGASPFLTIVEVAKDAVFEDFEPDNMPEEAALDIAQEATISDDKQNFKRLSRNGLFGLVTVINALTNNRASLLFQQVVDIHEAIPEEEEDEEVDL